MLDKLKEKYEASKQFVIDHPTVIACAVTAAVVSVGTHKYDLSVSKDLFYELGRRHGLVEIQHFLMKSYLDDKGLREDYLEYAVDLGETMKVGD